MNILKSAASQLGYKVEISNPRLVGGSLSPPPSPKYPGLSCFVVEVRAGPDRYTGYGPNRHSAKRAAEHQALLGLQRAWREKREEKSVGEMPITDSTVADSTKQSSPDVTKNRHPIQSLPPHPLLVMMQELNAANPLTPTVHHLSTSTATTNPGHQSKTSSLKTSDLCHTSMEREGKAENTLSAGLLLKGAEDCTDYDDDGDSEDVEFLEEWEEEEEEEGERREKGDNYLALPTEGAPFFTL